LLVSADLTGKALAGLLSRKRPHFYLTKLLSSLEAQDKVVASGAKASYRGIPLTALARTYSDRIIVVGTAAGQVKPTTAVVSILVCCVRTLRQIV